MPFEDEGRMWRVIDVASKPALGSLVDEDGLEQVNLHALAFTSVSPGSVPAEVTEADVRQDEYLFTDDGIVALAAAVLSTMAQHMEREGVPFPLPLPPAPRAVPSWTRIIPAWLLGALLMEASWWLHGFIWRSVASALAGVFVGAGAFEVARWFAPRRRSRRRRRPDQPPGGSNHPDNL